MSNPNVATPLRLPLEARTIAPCITSETSPLQQVIVHTPGAELEQVAPDSRLELLFDDILFVEQARREHRQMCALFEQLTGCTNTVIQVTDLLREAFDREAARYDFVEQICGVDQVSNLQAFERELKQLSPEELHHFALTGLSPLPLNVPPLPNLVFTRDLAAVVHGHILMSHAATAARARESILINVILHHHPSFADIPLIELPRGVTFEGGDLLVPDPEVVLIGQSERTSLSGIMTVARALFSQTPVKHVLVVDLPKARFCMHLDTVFTFCTPHECVVFPPLIEREEPGSVLHLQPGETPGQFHTTMHARLQEPLEALLDRQLTFIPCGGRDWLSQKREQWTDGANFFAVAPGVVVGYERNGHTFDMMREHGYRILSARQLLALNGGREADGKVAIKLGGTELSRGRGGPRCMTLPLARQNC